MKKRIAWALFGLCLAFPFVLLFFPGTGWVVKNHLRTAFARPDWTQLGMKEDDGWEAMSLGDYYDRPPTGSDRDSRLTQFGYNFNSHVENQFDLVKENWNDSLFLAIYTARASQFAYVPGRLPDPGSKYYNDALESMRKRQQLYHETWLHVVEACEQGEKLEPRNGFFPAYAANFADALGLRDRTIQNLARSRGCTTWDDHAPEIRQIWKRVLLKQYGYRGRLALDLVDTTYWPWVARLRPFAEHIANWPSAQPRRDFLKLTILAYRNAARYYEISSAAQLVNAALGCSYDDQEHLTRVERRDKVLGLVAAIGPDSESKTADGLPATLREMIASSDFGQARSKMEVENPVPERSWWEEWFEPSSFPFNAVPGIILTSTLFVLLFSIPALSMFRLLPERSGPPAGAPALAAAAACLLRLDWQNWNTRDLGIAGAFALFYLITARLSTSKRFGLPALISALIIPPVVLFMLYEAMINPATLEDSDSYLHAFLVFPVCLYTVLLGRHFYMRNREPSKFFLLPQLAVLALGISCPLLQVALFVSGKASFLHYIALFLIEVTTVAAWQYVSLAEAARQIRRYTYWVVAVVAFMLGMVIIWESIVDRKGISYLTDSGPSASEARQWAHEHPDGLLAEYRIEDAKLPHRRRAMAR
jgi:hypothetical protein